MAFFVVVATALGLCFVFTVKALVPFPENMGAGGAVKQRWAELKEI